MSAQPKAPDEEATKEELYVSVDVEAAGPVPGQYSLLALGACSVNEAATAFYVELRPINDSFTPEAIRVSGLSLDQLRETGKPPALAMTEFRDWIRQAAGNRRPVFVGFNASFDWAFVNWYFHVFVGDNPFGIGGIDIKAYYMGLVGCRWSETSSSQLPDKWKAATRLTHNALDDARAQAEVFAKLLTVGRVRPQGAPSRPTRGGRNG